MAAMPWAPWVRAVDISPGYRPPIAYSGRSTCSRAAAKACQPMPSAPGCEGVAASGPSTAKSQPSCRAWRSSSWSWQEAATGSARGQRAAVEAGQLRGAQVDADVQVDGELDVAVDQDLGAGGAAGLRGLGGQCRPARGIEARRAQLHPAHPLSQRALERRQPALPAAGGRGRDQVAVGLQQRGDDRAVGRRHVVLGQLVRRHPGQGLALVAAGGAAPGADVAHVQAQALVRVGLRDADHGVAQLDVDAEFLVQFAREGGFGRFVGFALAAGEFPEAGEVAALGAAGEQDAAARVGDDPGDDFDDGGRSSLLPPLAGGCPVRWRRGFRAPVLPPRAGEVPEGRWG
jgi:hypothetical protein